METGRFQPAIKQERFGGAPFGAEGLSVSFVSAAYGATGVKQNPGELAFRVFSRGKLKRKEPEFPRALKN
ncbi:MAG TPA: hypothetical protein GX523_02385 [Desulfitobacterium dehalogenans]|uniref:Uncharacterized protein n=1 Tax=Desulfitobacterium dehalogenans TaxID=36854 RepID=A0A7C7D7V3_9FIRM|nr:hypothetical protein [Desulfitobacterium dehalogenans]